jgi:cell division cycle 2-like protein
VQLLRLPSAEWGPCRHVDGFEKLNDIEEGSYGWVSRARDVATSEVVALKKLKMDNANDGFPVTGLREIQTLMEARHPHIVNLREVVVGDSFDEYVDCRLAKKNSSFFFFFSFFFTREGPLLLFIYVCVCVWVFGLTMASVFLVMDFIEHDLKTLQEDMAEPFLASEVKTLLRQIAAATDFLHSNWILHRDIKTSNLLMNNRGQIKLADFGMARHFGEPPPRMTQLVVTLWYRAPELLLGTEAYGRAVDVWSIGCVFGELLLKEPLLQGKNEVDQLSKVSTCNDGQGFLFGGGRLCLAALNPSLIREERKTLYLVSILGLTCDILDIRAVWRSDRR